MARTALIVSSNVEAVGILQQILESKGISAGHSENPDDAALRLADERFAILIMDCEDQTKAMSLIAAARAASQNRGALIVAIIDSHNDTKELFDRGANFVMYKPVSLERATESLQAAWSLLPPERRRKERVHVSSQASITFATTEDAPVPLLNLSEDGIAIHSQSRMPPPGRVYFQFTLPGQAETVRLSAEVIWQDWRGRAGLHFAHVPQASRRVLSAWLKENSNRNPEKRDASSPRIERFVLPTPEPRIAVPSTAVASDDNRRVEERRSCRLGVSVRRLEGSAVQRCTLTDMGPGGCYVETSEPLAIGAGLVIEVYAQDLKLNVHGKVRSMHRGYGMGIEFRLKTAEDRKQVQQLLASIDEQLSASSGREALLE
jgi:CheY-like chemotaxis protein